MRCSNRHPHIGLHSSCRGWMCHATVMDQSSTRAVDKQNRVGPTASGQKQQCVMLTNTAKHSIAVQRIWYTVQQQANMCRHENMWDVHEQTLCSMCVLCRKQTSCASICLVPRQTRPRPPERQCHMCATRKQTQCVGCRFNASNALCHGPC